MYRTDPKNIPYGNPALDPEPADSYELSYSTTATLGVSGSVRHTGNAIEQVRLPTDEPCITAQTFVNVAANAFYRLSFCASAKPTAK